MSRLVSQVSLVWSMLLHDRRRFVRSLSAVAAAMLLMYSQIAFYYGLFDSQTGLLRHLRGDLFLAPRLRFSQSVNHMLRFPVQRIHQARGVSGVAAAWPLYTEFNTARWRHPGTGKISPLLVVGFRLEDPVWEFPHS